MPSLLNTTVTANYLKTSPSTQFGTRKLKFITVTLAGSGAPSLLTQALYASAAGATGTTTTITVGSTVGLQLGMTVAVTTGTGVFATGTTVTAITGATTLTVSAAPTTALSGGASVVTGYFANVSGGSYTDSGSYLSTAVRTIQQYTEIFAVGTPAANGLSVTVVIADNTADDSALSSNLLDGSWGDLESALWNALGAWNTPLGSNVAVASKDLVGATLG